MKKSEEKVVVTYGGIPRQGWPSLPLPPSEGGSVTHDTRCDKKEN